MSVSQRENQFPKVKIALREFIRSVQFVRFGIMLALGGVIRVSTLPPGFLQYTLFVLYILIIYFWMGHLQKRAYLDGQMNMSTMRRYAIQSSTFSDTELHQLRLFGLCREICTHIECGNMKFKIENLLRDSEITERGY